MTLHVVSHTANPAYNSHLIDKTINSASVVQRLYASTLGLPILPANARLQCLATPPITYILSFIQNGRLVHVMSLDIMCATLKEGSTLKVAENSFQESLASALGISSLY
jgi:hypothetical protein